jgi:MFS transporter, DHA1 family, inner membrane transport protein
VTTVLAPGRRVLAYASGGFGLAMNAMVQFLLPLRADELGIGIGTIGLLLGAKAITEALMSVPLGGFMDRVGTRRAYLIGTGVSTVVALGFLLATSTWMLLVLQVFLGMVRPLGWVGAQSYVAGLASGEERARDTGRFSFCANVAQIAAPLLVGTAAQVLGVREAFGVFGAYSGVFFLLGLFLPDVGREAVTAGGRHGSFIQALGLLRLPGIQVAMLLTFARLWIPSTFSSFLPLFLVSSGVTEGIAGSVVSAMAVTSTVVALFTGRIARLGRPEPLTAAALGIAAVGLALAPFIAELPWVYLSAMMVGIGQGLSLPMLITIVSNGAPPQNRGLALGLRSSVNQVAAAIAPVTVAAVIGAAGITVGFPVAGGVAGTVLVAGAVLDHVRHSRPAAADSS